MICNADCTGPDRLTFAADRHATAAAGFDDDRLYREVPKSPEARLLPRVCLLREEAQEAFRRWLEKEGRVAY